jgi:ABC-type branched-subunit amino acid transport system ATPase component
VEAAKRREGLQPASGDQKLEAKGLVKVFGGIKAVNGVDFEVGPGEIVGLMGPNGAGKSTLIHLLTGIVVPDEGTVRYRGHRLDGKPAHRIARQGIGRTFQIAQPFAQMTVQQNVMVGVLFSGQGKSRRDARDRAEESLRLLGLGHKIDEDSTKISTGETKRMDLARVLAMDPDLMFLDEPVSGLSREWVDRVLQLLTDLAREGKSVVIVEHVQRAVWKIAHRVVVLHRGRTIADGPPGEVAEDEAVISAYLGDRYLEISALDKKGTA